LQKICTNIHQTLGLTPGEASIQSVTTDIAEADSELMSDGELASSEDGSDWSDDFIPSASSKLPPELDPDERRARRTGKRD